MVQKYGKIGKSVLKRLLGLQQDGYIYQMDDASSEIDLEKSGCGTCPYYLLAKNTSDQKTLAFCSQKCSACSSKVYLPNESTGTKKYIYEKSKYGYTKPMYLNSIKVFLYIHLYGYDSKSFVKDLEIREIADYFGLNMKTVRRALQKLSDYDYLYSTSPSEPVINILLPEAHTYAQVGGAGYFELTKDLLDELVKIRNINSLRIILRTLLEFDEGFSKGQDRDIIKKRITDIHKYLPHYAKPHIILDCIQKTDSIFETISDKNIVHFHIKEQFKTKIQHGMDLLHAEDKLKSFLSDFNQDVASINEKALVPQESHYAEYFENSQLPVNSYSSMFFKAEDCKKLATIFVKYDLAFMKRVLIRIYQHINSTGIKIENPEAYIRTTIQNLIKMDLFNESFSAYEIA